MLLPTEIHYKTLYIGGDFMVIPKGSIERKAYHWPSRCPDISLACSHLIESILYCKMFPVQDFVNDAARDSLYLYDDDLFATTNSNMQSYIDLVDSSSLTGSNYAKMIKIMVYAQEMYFEEQLEANLQAIIQNALIQYVESIDISAALPCNRERITAFFVSHIENIIADSSKPFNTYIEDLNNAISENFLAEIIRRK